MVNYACLSTIDGRLQCRQFVKGIVDFLLEVFFDIADLFAFMESHMDINRKKKNMSLFSKLIDKLTH